MLEPQYIHFLADVLDAREIDHSFIDHSLSYAENKTNLHKQFGVFAAKSDIKRARKYEDMSKDQKPKAESRPRAIAEVPMEPKPLQPFPFDPITRAKEMESLVMQGDKRLYYRFRFQSKWWAPSVADTTGCCLDCAFCWNHRRNRELPGSLKSPGEVAQKLNSMSHDNKGEDRAYYMRTGGCEPVLGLRSAKHLADILKNCQAERFLLESNGLNLGYNLDLFDLLEPYKDMLWVRITAKADNPAAFEAITGAKKGYFEYPFKAAHEGKKRGFDVSLAYMPEFVDPAKLRKASKWEGHYDTENLHCYAGVMQRLKDRDILKLRLDNTKPKGGPAREGKRPVVCIHEYDERFTNQDYT